jgi:hypothetical protein
VTVRAERLAAVMEGDLPDDIISIIEAVKFWEVNIQIEDVAEKGTAELRVKGPLKEMKRAG